ncbi:MAG: AAC(3) family N-acetyltransferase [Fibromonadaceae bacterium]|jgi:aminoglycoside 3-N-acetyltransferase|nr:AAC(3) family N-acetyltransferase [Fibromonadaceae bacterium]
MYTKQNLMDNMATMNIDPHGALLIHLSYKAIGETENRAETVLDAFVEYMKPGLLVLPSHTWRNVNNENPVMDILHTPSCVGICTELFRRRPGIQRSLHPTHSVAALGKDAEEFIAGEEKMQTPCGKGGVYYKLWERNAQILLIGVNFSRSTFIHGVEEWDGAIGSISEEKTELYVINRDGGRLYTPQYRHCSSLGSRTFVKLEPEALSQGVMTISRFGNATARLVRAKPIRTLAAKFLAEDPQYLMWH